MDGKSETVFEKSAGHVAIVHTDEESWAVDCGRYAEGGAFG